MKTRWIAMLVVVAAACGWFASAAFTEDEPADPAAPVDPMMEEMIKLGQPGPHHKFLEPLAGNWTVESSMWMGPGEPTLSKATATSTWVLGGRFLRQDYVGENAGMPFKGLGYTGYDNYKKEYVGLWMDDWSSGYMPITGQASEDGKTITTHGEWEGPMGKFTFRYVTEIKSPDEHTMTMYMSQGGGEEMKHMELIYRRKAE